MHSKTTFYFLLIFSFLTTAVVRASDIDKEREEYLKQFLSKESDASRALKNETEKEQENESSNVNELAKESIENQNSLDQGLEQPQNEAISDTPIESPDTIPEVVDSTSSLTKEQLMMQEKLKELNSGLKQKTKTSFRVTLELIPIMIANFKAMSEEAVIKDLNDAASDEIFYPILQKFPKLIVFYARMLRDDRAFLDIVSIIENEVKIVLYALVVLTTFVVGRLLKRVTFWRARDKWHERRLRFQLFLFVNGLRIFLFFFVFQVELSSTIKIFKKTFL